MTRTFHMCVSIAGVLRWPDNDLMKMFSDDNGHRRPARLVRDFLKLELLKGRRVLPLGEPCEGWSYSTGCPGHPEEPSLPLAIHPSSFIPHPSLP